jgi:flagellar biosynthesis chaperone FliJ
MYREYFTSSAIDVMPLEETRKYMDFEDMKCKFVYDNLKNTENLDVLQNYTLVNYDTPERDQCYIKNSDTLVENACSKDNPNLYDPRYSNLVTDIYPKLMKDQYMSPTIPLGTCIIKFNKQSASQTLIRDYLDDLDAKLPKLQNLKRDIDALKLRYRELVEKRDLELKNQQNLVSRINGNQSAVNTLNNNINALNDEINTKQNSLNDLKGKITNREQKYQEIQNKSVLLCKDRDFKGKCVEFPIGRYNALQMIRQGIGNDQISSLKVPEGLVAKLYSDTLDFNYNPTGDKKFAQIEGERNIPFIGDESWTDGTKNPKLNDAISSVIIEPKPLA